MRVLLLLIFFFLGTRVIAQSNIDNYKYWFDEDFTNAVVVSEAFESEEELSYMISGSSLSKGLHTLHLCFNSSGKWSSVSSFYFFVTNQNQNTTTQIKYWIDDNYNAAQTKENAEFVLNTSHLKDGLHHINFVYRDVFGSWSSVISEIFVIDTKSNINTNKITEAKYWIDSLSAETETIIAVNNLSSRFNLDKTVDLSQLSIGKHYLFFQFKDVIGNYSSILLDSVYKTPPVVDIINLLEPINQEIYEVPREARVHIYYQAVDTLTRLPVPGIVLNYTLSNNPTTIRSSKPSEVDGLIDLYVTIGGSDSLNSSDDWINGGAASISFHSFSGANFVRINDLETNNHVIGVSNKAVPIETKEGIAFRVDKGLNVSSNKKAFKIGSKDVLRKGAASAGLGIGGGLTIEYSPVPGLFDVWDFSANLNIFGNLEAKLDLNKTGEKKPYSSKNFRLLINLEGEVEISPEFGVDFRIDLNQPKQCFYLGAGLLLSKEDIAPQALKVANALTRAIKILETNSISQYPVVLNGFRVGTSVSMSGGGTAVFKTPEVVLANNEGYAREEKIGVDVKLDYNGTIGLEATFNKLKSKPGHTFTLSTFGGHEINSSISAFNRLTKRGDLNFRKQEFVIPIYEEAQLNKIRYQNYLIDGSPKFVTYTVGSVKEEQANFDNTLTSFLSSTWRYSEKAIDILGVGYYRPAASIYNNSLISFIYFNSTNSIFKSSENIGMEMLQLNEYAINNSEENWGVEELNFQTNREIALEKVIRAPEFPFLKARALNFELKNWIIYNHKLVDSKYSGSLKRLLKTYDIPNVDHILDIPEEVFFDTFWNKIKTHVSDLAPSVLTEALDFVVENKDIIVDFVKCVGNGGCPLFGLKEEKQILRKNLNGINIYDSRHQTYSNSNGPSLMNFTVEPNVFNAETLLSFDYFYPENKLTAISEIDTFRIVSDVFSLQANIDGIKVDTAQNGFFRINSTFSVHDLELALLPSNLIPYILFKPNEANYWEVIGSTDTEIEFNRLGEFAIAVKIENDFELPVINLTYPDSFKSGKSISVSFSDVLSGINWERTEILINGQVFNYQRTGISGVVTIPIDSLGNLEDSTYRLQIMTFDLAGNTQSLSDIFPCSASSIIQNISNTESQYIHEEALNRVQVGSRMPSGKDILINAGHEILLSPGFEVKNGKSFKAEIKGCSEP